MRIESDHTIDGSQNPAQMAAELRAVADEIDDAVAIMTALGANSPIIFNGNSLIFNLRVEGELP